MFHKGKISTYEWEELLDYEEIPYEDCGDVEECTVYCGQMDIQVLLTSNVQDNPCISIWNEV
jgi:hypothetical protein